MKLLKIVCRTLLAHPFTATDGLATLRGAKAVALPARARMTEVFILQIYPLLFVEQEPRRYEHKPMCEACKLVAKRDLAGHPNTAPGTRPGVFGGPHPA